MCDQMANGNSDPTIVTPTTDSTIPINTPFILDNTTAVDLVDGDPLSYQWDQLDAGLATNSATFGTDLGDNALFRSYAPRTVSFRNFPALSTQLNNEYDDPRFYPVKPAPLIYDLQFAMVTVVRLPTTCSLRQIRGLGRFESPRKQQLPILCPIRVRSRLIGRWLKRTAPRSVALTS